MLPSEESNPSIRQPGRSATGVFWFRVPDDEAWLMGLRPAELKCYLVVARGIQRDQNRGRLSVRQVADRANLQPKHALSALACLVDQGRLARDGKPGSTAVYSLPSEWRNRSPTGEQLEEMEQANCTPTGEQHCTPTGEQNCSPTGEQHLEFLESSEKPSSSTEYPGRFEEVVNTDPVPTTTAADVPQETETPKQPQWTDEGLQAREALRDHFEAPMLPDWALTRDVLAHMSGIDDLRLWLLDLAGRRVKVKGWGFYKHDAAEWPARRADVQQQVDAHQQARAVDVTVGTALVVDREVERLEQQQAREEFIGLAERNGCKRFEPESSCQKCYGYGFVIDPIGEVCSCSVGQICSRRHEWCHRCANAGIHADPQDGCLIVWCECVHAARLRERKPDTVEGYNGEVINLRTVMASARSIERKDVA